MVGTNQVEFSNVAQSKNMGSMYKAKCNFVSPEYYGLNHVSILCFEPTYEQNCNSATRLVLTWFSHGIDREDCPVISM